MLQIQNTSIFSVITVQYVLNILFPRIQGMKRKALKVSHEIWLVYNLSMIGALCNAIAPNSGWLVTHKREN